jgi:hypothetical protein
MQNKAKTLTDGSSQPEVFNVLGQLKTIERVQEMENLIIKKRSYFSEQVWKKSSQSNLLLSKGKTQN